MYSTYGARYRATGGGCATLWGPRKRDFQLWMMRWTTPNSTSNYIYPPGSTSFHSKKHVAPQTAYCAMQLVAFPVVMCDHDNSEPLHNAPPYCTRLLQTASTIPGFGSRAVFFPKCPHTRPGVEGLLCDMYQLSKIKRGLLCNLSTSS